MTEAGKIRNRVLVSQIRDFSGFDLGTITPTDIDGYIEYRGKAHIIFELKSIGSDLPVGQRLALERLVDDLNKSGKFAIGFIAEHNNSTTEDIIARDAIIKEYRYKNVWHQCKKVITLKEASISFLKNKAGFTTQDYS